MLLNDGVTVTGNVVDNGTLQVNQSGSLTISNTISGTGTINLDSGGALQIGVGGMLALSGTGSIGTGGLNLGTTGSPGAFDLVSGNGSVVFGGILNLAFSGGTYADGTDVLQIFANTGGLFGGFSAGTFSGLAAGQSATFNPTTGFITVVPEPSTYAMALAGLACGGYVVVRCRKQA